jgi:hypothetical protein
MRATMMMVTMMMMMETCNIIPIGMRVCNLVGQECRENVASALTFQNA